jgi:hypothetical protein
MATLFLVAGAKYVATSFALNSFASAALITGASLIGSYIDSKLFGQTVSQEGPRLDEVRFTGSSHTAPIARVGGRFRIAGNIIWSTRYREEVVTETGSSGGKGLSRTRTKSTTYNYYVSFAVGLCEGPIYDIGRIWADNRLLDGEDYTIRKYYGTNTQMPDPKIVAVEGAAFTPAYRGLAYIVFEELHLEEFGNRIPQINVEVIASNADSMEKYEDRLAAVDMIPAAGEFCYGTTPVYTGKGDAKVYENRHSYGTESDLQQSVGKLLRTAPNCSRVALVVAWHGTDLRCNHCQLQPRVEADATTDKKVTRPYAWKVSGIGRAGATKVSVDADGAIYLGGAPADRAVYEAIVYLKSKGLDVVFYPFILMDIPPGNTLTDPYSNTSGQPAFPWRGRITLSLAPGVAGSPNRTSTARTQVETFFGTCLPSHFAAYGGNANDTANENDSNTFKEGTISNTPIPSPPPGTEHNTIKYTGPNEWSYRRMILHYAKLCASVPGGVYGFIIGSEMVGLNKIQDNAGAFPAVDKFVELAADVRSILGPNVKITYAADWSEWSNYRPSNGSGDVYWPLDKLWASANIDAIGIDNYMPLSDWRSTADHLDADDYDSIYDLDYLKGNIAGGEGYDWYYASTSNRDNQIRTPITDTAYNKHWVFRYKDIVSWWQNTHITRILGVEGHPILQGRVASNYTTASDTTVTADYGVDAFDNRTVRVQHNNNTTAYYRRSNLSVTNGATYRLIVRMRTVGGGAQTTYLNIQDSQHNRQLINVTGSWQTFVLQRTVNSSTVHVYPSDPRGGSGSPNCDLEIAVAAFVRVGGTTEWVAQSKPIWFTELGCPAVQFGSNQPNVFYDPKSSESFFPYYSNGSRDDYIQRQFNKAHLEYWSDNQGTALNPTGMVDPSHIFIWTWDARPFPEFPSRSDVWDDSENWRLGHWINGRLAVPEIGDYIVSLFDQAGLDSQYIDVSEVYGLISGFAVTQTNTVRDMLDPIMFTNLLQAYESEGKLKFRHKGNKSVGTVNFENLVADEEGADSLGGPVTVTRSDDLELPQEVRISFVDDNTTYESSVAYYRNPVGYSNTVSESNVNVLMDFAYAEDLCARLLQEVYIAREKLTFKMPPSMLRFDPTDVIDLDVYGRTYTVTLESINEEYQREVTASKYDADVFIPVAAEAPKSKVPAAIVGQDTVLEILNLPILHSSASPSGVYFAAAGKPWNQGVAVMRSPNNVVYQPDVTVEAPSIIGVTDFALPAGPAGRWDKGTELFVTVNSAGTLDTVSNSAVFQGFNAAALYNAAAGQWEVIQWKTAQAVATNRYKLTNLIRGQLGTEKAIGNPLPAGSRFVVLDPTRIVQSTGGANLIGLTLHWKFGPAHLASDSDSWKTATAKVKGFGYRPYSPCSLKATKQFGNNDILLDWKRRTRFNGDVWDGSDVPLNEDFEKYEVDVYNGNNVVRTITVTGESATVYTSAMQIADFGAVQSSIKFEVFQISAIFGRGVGRMAIITFPA